MHGTRGRARSPQPAQEAVRPVAWYSKEARQTVLAAAAARAAALAAAAAVPAPAVVEPYSTLGGCDLDHTFGQIKLGQ